MCHDRGQASAQTRERQWVFDEDVKQGLMKNSAARLSPRVPPFSLSNSRRSRHAARSGMPKQSAETFLLEMLVVGQNLGQPFTAHGFHGNRSGCTPCPARVVEPQASEKATPALWNDADVGIIDQTVYRQPRLLSKSLIRRTEGQELSQYFIGRNNRTRGRRGCESYDFPMGAVFRIRKRNPIERVCKKTHCWFRRGEPYR